MKQHATTCKTNDKNYVQQHEIPRDCDCDGYHTFTELYDHRIRLFIALMWANWEKSWASKIHSDGSSWNGWFIAGIHTKAGDVTYHLPIKYWDELFKCRDDGTGNNNICIMTLDKAPEFDGHTSDDVIERLKKL